MPKAERNYRQTKGAVLARERREREKKDTQYNNALKEFLHLKYSHIIAEFDPMYKNIMARRPANLIYTNTTEFRLWRRREMHKELQPEHPVEQQVEQQVEQPVEQQVEQSIEQQVEQPVEQQVEQPIEQQVEQPIEQQVEQPIEQQQQVEQPVKHLQDEQLAGLLQDEQLVELLQQIEQPVEHLQDELLADPEQLVNEIVVNNSSDEGIVLDAWEELYGDIRDFDYRLEIELGQYLP